MSAAIIDQGFDNARYKVIPRTLVFIQNNDSILLIKGASTKKNWPNLYNGIGGHIERGEDVISSARREVFEETGILNPHLQFSGTISIDLNEDTGILLFIFKGIVECKDILPSIEGDLHWVKLCEMNNYPLVEDLYELIPKLFLQDNKIISARYHYYKEKLLLEFNEMK